ncbi:Nitrous oxide reductase maturation protein NosD [hydrothermal vent metagenome]|uniref:Nitrous oxide reductase maturation protein NosD n=1 Tax=hydrothermal vent metagenome TaxID=652676 RepID=A0A3B0VWU3_9ZZZZ
MKYKMKYKIVLLLITSLLILPNSAIAAQIHVNTTDNLQQILDQSNDGDTIVLADGTYYGNLVINQQITLTGSHKAKIIGDKTGSSIKIMADNVIIENISIAGSGLDLSEQNSGVFVNQNTKNVTIRDNHLENNLIGVYLWGSINTLVVSNRIIGQKFHRVNERGNGIQLWNSPGSVVTRNYISYGRDGIFTTTSRDNEFSHNYFDNLRYSIHYMYTKNSTVSHNYSKQNKIGYALMFSDGLTVKNNVSINDSERGIFSNFMNDSLLSDNTVIGASKKCLMLYNANYNTITNNHFEQCNIGVHYTAGSQNNSFSGNSFINNHKQVKYVGSKLIEWSKDGKGNFWSDHVAFDLNTDGIADAVYRPNSITDQILWSNSNTKALLNSPAIQILKWSQSYFPALLPGGAKDSFPLLTPVRKINYHNLFSKQAEQI